MLVELNEKEYKALKEALDNSEMEQSAESWMENIENVNDTLDMNVSRLKYLVSKSNTVADKYVDEFNEIYGQLEATLKKVVSLYNTIEG